MAQKNNPMRFTVQFSPGDPCHQQTVDILNQQGRRKAQFIVNAVMHYINCSEIPMTLIANPQEMHFAQYTQYMTLNYQDLS